MPLGASFWGDVLLVELMYVVFTRMLGGVTVGESGICCCVPCLSSATISLCLLGFVSFFLCLSLLLIIKMSLPLCALNKKSSSCCLASPLNSTYGSSSAALCFTASPLVNSVHEAIAFATNGFGSCRPRAYACVHADRRRNESKCFQPKLRAC